MPLRPFIASLFLILYGLLVGGYGSSLHAAEKVLSYKELTTTFPHGVENGSCYLFRIDGCSVIVPHSPNLSDSVSVFFVTTPKKPLAEKTAQRLAELFSGHSKIIPFAGKEAGYAVPLTANRTSRSFAAGVLAQFISNYRDSLQFIGWRGTHLRFRIEHTHDSSGNNRKHKGTIEIDMELTTSRVEYMEFRLVKGNLNDEEMAEFVMKNVKGSPHYHSLLSDRSSADYKNLFNSSCDPIVISADFCIVRKGRVYHSGRYSVVRKLLNERERLAHFNLPDRESVWPQIEKLASDSSVATNRSSSTTSPETNGDASSPRQGEQTTNSSLASSDQQSATHELTPEPKEKKTPQRAFADYVSLLDSL